jgi:hypothetical protein
MVSPTLTPSLRTQKDEKLIYFLPQPQPRFVFSGGGGGVGAGGASLGLTTCLLTGGSALLGLLSDVGNGRPLIYFLMIIVPVGSLWR